jgi:hypothetical protein
MSKPPNRWQFKIPKRFTSLLFPFLLSGFMTLLITGISITRVLGVNTILQAPSSFFQTWMKAYISAWLVAYPILLLAIPVVHRIVNWLTTDE